MTTPATISPTTAGTLIRSAISAASFAAIEHDEDVEQNSPDVHGCRGRQPTRAASTLCRR